MTFNASATMNPLLAPWPNQTPGGNPPFDQVKVTDFVPALNEGMKSAREKIKIIASNKEPATFQNTIVPLEEIFVDFQKIKSVYNVWSQSVQTPEFQKVENEMAPILSAFDDEMIQNVELFKRIEAVDASPVKAKLTSEEQRLVWNYKNNFIRRGAKLTEAQKAKVAEINQRLATLSTQFSQNQLGDEENEYLLIENKDDLAGLPQSEIDSAAEEASRRGMKGKWAISNTRSSMEPFLTYSSQRSLREKAFRIWSSRGDNANAHNNSKLVTEIMKLRQERSKILGYSTYAHWSLSNTMAKDPQKAMDLMMKVWKRALARVKQEVKDMQAIVDTEKGGFKIQPWDYRFYSEKVRKAKYDLDLNAVKPYLQLSNIQQSMFYVADRLYGLHFNRLEGVPTIHPSMSVYRVTGPKDRFVGLWYFDPYARPGKRSGAWMDSWREQTRMNGKDVTTIVSNNSNFVQGKPGEPVLISWDDANTMFHEFGHALHGLNSNATYPSVSGTNTLRDFVEFPSQFHENYLDTPEVLKFLKDKDGQSIPAALLKKIDRAKTFNQGFQTVEFLASAIVDMKLHLEPNPIDPTAFEKKALAEMGMPSEIIMRHRIPHFGHLFSDEGYAAGYYSYLWAEVLEADAFEAFTQKSGAFDPKVAKRFKDHIMSVGDTIDPEVTYRKFRGRDPKVNALLEKKGL